MDGIDVSDETLGSTTTNVPASGIQEFQLSQSSLDLSTELTTSGAINVTTRSGTNAIHGEAFDFFRDSSLAAALPSPPGLSEPFQRSQYGGRVGGPIIKNRFFYFLDGERTLAAFASAGPGGELPSQQYSGASTRRFTRNQPSGESGLSAGPRQCTHSIRFGYFQNSFMGNGGIGLFRVLSKNITRTHVAGFDFNTGSFTHSIRFGYLKTEARPG